MTGKATHDLSAIAAMLASMASMVRQTPPAAYFLECIRADSARLAEVARTGTDALVPSCPDWTVADLVEHLAVVYLHKVEAIRTNARPHPWPPDVSGRDPLELYGEATAALLAELEDHSPFDPAWTFRPDDQTCGFWFRRMAHETAVHRVDAELAHDVVTPVDDQLATDGVDEVLRIMLCDPWWNDHDADEPVDAVVRITTGGRSWTVTVPAGMPTVAEGTEGEVAVEIFGEPDDVYLWLWGRRSVEAVQAAGDDDVVRRFRRRLAETLT